MTGRYTTLFGADTPQSLFFSLGWDLPEDARQFWRGLRAAQAAAVPTVPKGPYRGGSCTPQQTPEMEGTDCAVDSTVHPTGRSRTPPMGGSRTTKKCAHVLMNGAFWRLATRCRAPVNSVGE